MRIARLDLTRYGRFSDHTIDFGAARTGAPDFHIVYGLNEAGKSTAAAAILDLLFGIEKQSPYGAAEARANWHAYNAMRVGARIEIGGRAHEIARLKRDKNSLVDKENRPLDETFLKTELAGVDRAAFRMMFSLDDESLEKGGEAILASRGDLGELLFSASAGLAEFSGRLDALREKAERFFRPRAKMTRARGEEARTGGAERRARQGRHARLDLCRTGPPARRVEGGLRGRGQKPGGAPRPRRSHPAVAGGAAASGGAQRGGSQSSAARQPPDAAGWMGRGRREAAGRGDPARSAKGKRRERHCGLPRRAGANRRRCGGAANRKPGGRMAGVAQPVRHGEGHSGPSGRTRRQA